MNVLWESKLPEGIEEEWEEDYKDHLQTDIQFAHGTSAGYTALILLLTKVGDFYYFHHTFPLRLSVLHER